MGWCKSSPPSSVLLNRDTLYSLDELRKESIHSYDTGEYDFIGAIQEAFADTLAIDPSELPRLDLLHLDPSCAAFDKDGSNNAINTIQLKWNSKRDKQHMERDAFSRFNDVYRRFVSNVIGPLMVSTCCHILHSMLLTATMRREEGRLYTNELRD
jgi:hypothetical protein